MLDKRVSLLVRRGNHPFEDGKKDGETVMKNSFIRAARTFVQAAVGYLAANVVMTVSGVGDGSLRRTLATLITAAVASGLAAVMNMPHRDKNGTAGDGAGQFRDEGEEKTEDDFPSASDVTAAKENDEKGGGAETDKADNGTEGLYE